MTDLNLKVELGSLAVEIEELKHKEATHSDTIIRQINYMDALYQLVNKKFRAGQLIAGFTVDERDRFQRLVKGIDTQLLNWMMPELIQTVKDIDDKQDQYNETLRSAMGVHENDG